MNNLEISRDLIIKYMESKLTRILDPKNTTEIRISLHVCPFNIAWECMQKVSKRKDLIPVEFGALECNLYPAPISVGRGLVYDIEFYFRRDCPEDKNNYCLSICGSVNNCTTYLCLDMCD